MNQPFVQRLRIKKRFQSRTRRAHAAHHIHVGITGIVGKISRTRVGLDLQRVVIHDQHRHGHLGRQAVHAIQQHLFHRRLHVGIQRRSNQRRPLTRTARGRRGPRFLQQALRGQRRQPARAQWRRDHVFNLGVGDVGRSPAAQFGHAVQHLVARGLGRLGMAIGTQARRRLRQGGQHGGFGGAEIARGLAQPEP
ncbi:hypothetical protein D3C72_1015690 [compost metagenome]